MQTLKIAVLTDHALVPRFGLEALNEIRGCDAVSLYSCTNTRLKRRPGKHLAYYLLNLLSIRNPLTRTVPAAACDKRIDRQVNFESRHRGAWQELPDDIVDNLAGSGFDVIIKLGMGLLTVPDADRLRTPILSFHHGDPDEYRGRPAGFWEMLHGRPTMGQIVQVLSNQLDAGKVVAFAETKLHPHSYRRSLIESYRHSRLLINRAIANALGGVSLPKTSTGKNYRLPSNRTVIRFVTRMAAAFVKRTVYGLAFEKHWQVSHAPSSDPAGIADGRTFPSESSWHTLPIPSDYLFYADPFFSREPPGILVEALSRKTALGEIVMVGDGGHRRLSSGGGHFSYPSTFRAGGRELVVPEIGQWSQLKAYRIADGRMTEAAEIRVAGDPRIVDPTLYEHDSRIYLFGNRADIGSNSLFLWSAPSLDDEFVPHPLNPVRISPRGARMAGGLVVLEGRLIRFGQSFVGDYGDGIFAFELSALGPSTYEERLIGEIKFNDRKGPHTLNFGEGRIVFDWYRDRFSPLAGGRRLLARLQQRSDG